MDPGILDTNVFIHAYMHDAHTQECQRFLRMVESGELRVRLEPIVVHELSYALLRRVRGITREQVIEYLLTVLHWGGIAGDLDVLEQAILFWRKSPALGFVDSFLATKAKQLDCPVYTKNSGDFQRLGVETPDPLPG